MTRGRWGSIVLLVLVAWPLTLSAQRVTRRIFVHVRAAGAAVSDLTAADFEVVENGVTREVTRAGLGKAPMRVVLLVDSSSTVAPMLNHVRLALAGFLDTLPREHEVAFITTGGQLRIRAQPTTDREKLRMEAARFLAEGGANSFVDSLLESDRRLLRSVTNWPVFVIMTTDNGNSLGAPRVEEYTRFRDDFVRRGGSAHGVVVKGARVGHITEFAENLIQNTGGLYDSVNLSSSLEERFKVIAARLAADHLRMAEAYELDYTSDGSIQRLNVEVSIGRSDVSIQMSIRRSF